MYIVRGMASTTVAWQRHGETLCMACVAVELTVPSRQCESGFRAVVKQHGFPIECVVTTPALRAETPFMRIVGLMAGIAVTATEA